MQVCIQDPQNNAIYVLNETELSRFEANEKSQDREVDVLLVLPADTLVQELPPARMTNSQTPTVQIVDPDQNRNWIIGFEDLRRYAVLAPPSDSEDMVWFAMPSAKDTLAAVPVFRRALVQHSS